MNTFVVAAFLLSLMAAVPAFFQAALYSRELERHVRLNQPSIWARIKQDPATEPSASSPLVRFVMRRGYRTVGDADLDALGDRCHRAYRRAVIAFLVVVLTGLASAVLWA